MIGIRRADGVPGRTGRGRGADEPLKGDICRLPHDAATVDSGERRRRGVHREPEDDLRPFKAADVDARQLRVYIVAPLAESSLVAGRRGASSMPSRSVDSDATAPSSPGAASCIVAPPEPIVPTRSLWTPSAACAQ